MPAWKRLVPVLLPALCLAAGGVTLDARDMPLRDALAAVAQQTRHTLDAADLADTTVNLRLRDVSLEVALQTLCRDAGLQYEVTADKIVIRPASLAPASVHAPEHVPPALLAQANRQLRAVLNRPTDRAAADALYAWLARQRPDWREKLPDYLADLWLAAAPQPAKLLRGARVLEQLGALAAAARLAREARGDKTVVAEADRLQAELMMQMGDTARASGAARRAAEEAPDDPAAAALLARALAYDAGRASEALADAMAAHARWPLDPTISATLGELLLSDPSALGEASRHLEDAAEADPRNAGARYHLAVLGASEAGDPEALWHAFLGLEPASARARRVRLGLATGELIGLTDRGGRVWDVSPDGERILFSERFRKQLQITDARGFGLALQVTDQETDKVWGAFSPDEETLAWVVEGATQQLYLQNAQASGHERMVFKAAPGSQLRRLLWTPDGNALIFTELAATGVPKLRCWDLKADKEGDVPAPWSKVDGLGDLSWAGQRAVGVLRREGRQAVVAVDRDGRIFTLRPPQVGLRYSAPTVAADLSRVIYQDTRTRELTGAPMDGAAGGEAPLLEAGASTESQIAVWFPDGRHVAMSKRDSDPAKVELLGLPPAPRLLVEMDPPLAAGTVPTRFTFHLLAGSKPAKASLRAVLVADDGQEAVVASKPLASGAAPVAVAPRAAETGVHWLRVETKVDGETAVRWYAYEVTGAG